MFPTGSPAHGARRVPYTQAAAHSHSQDRPTQATRTLWRIRNTEAGALRSIALPIVINAKTSATNTRAPHSGIQSQANSSINEESIVARRCTLRSSLSLRNCVSCRFIPSRVFRRNLLRHLPVVVLEPGPHLFLQAVR